MKTVIVLLKILLAIAAACSISLGIFLFSNADTEMAGMLTSWALVSNSFIVVLLLGIHLLQKRIKREAPNL